MNAEVHVKGAELTTEEQEQYVRYLEDKYGRTVAHLDITVDGEFVDLSYKFVPVQFERIRRITGYLVGTMDRWNNAKTAEEKDRVKHTTE